MINMVKKRSNKMKRKNILTAGIITSILIIIGIIIFIIINSNKITITYINDEKVSSTIKVKKRTGLTLPNTKKDGYIFLGWYYEDIKLDDGVWFDHDATLIAKWKKDTTMRQTITFDTDGGNKIAKQIIECDTKLDLPTTTKKGYKFVNWITEGDIVIDNESILVCQNMTLTAKWEKEEIEAEKENKETPEEAAEAKENE